MTPVLSMPWALAGLVTGAFGWHVPRGRQHVGSLSAGMDAPKTLQERLRVSIQLCL